MTTQEVKKHYSFQKWSSIIQECNASQLSTRQWCNQNGILEGTYYYWLKRIRLKSLEQLPALHTEINVQEVSALPTVFAKIPTPEKHASADVMISLNGMEIGLNSSATPELIQSVLLAVKQLC
ncbi:MAG: IS66 family insertion sequence element accessory protein TnpA [Mobilitalea sp.]